VRRKGVKYEKNQVLPCPKCGYDTAETKAMSMSTRGHKFGRQQQTYGEGDDDGDDGGYSGYGGGSGFTGYGGVAVTGVNEVYEDDGAFGGHYDDDSDEEYDYDEDDDEDENEDEEEEKKK